MAVQERTYSADDLLALSDGAENDGKRFELIEGELVEMSPAGGKHGGIAHECGRRVGNHVSENDLGYVTAAETGYILYKNPSGKDTVCAPDVGFVAKDRLPDGLPDGYIPLAPDLAIEVVSPNDSGEDIQNKIWHYLMYGTRMVVYVYPKSQTANVHTPTSFKTLTIDDTFDGDVLPGFTLPLKAIFK
jgi:Uma2 family endonuclease